jgi:glycosyltransferase involved in cell wall biosynthesis
MKIALVGNEYLQQFPLVSYGGIEASVEQLASGLHQSKTDFFCIVPQRETKLDYPFEVIETPFIPSSISKRPPVEFAQLIYDILKAKKPDIIWTQSHWSPPPLIGLNIPIICTFSDSCEKQEGWMIPHENIYYRFVSKFQYQLWVKHDWEKSRSVQIYNGLSDDEYDFGKERDPYFLWVGGLVWGWQAKGLDIFLKLARSNRDKRFIAYGTGSKVIEEELQKLSLAIPNFEFKGELKRGKQHKEVFKRARAFIMPTQIPEALGRTCLESLSKGTPVLGSAKGALPEVVKNCGITTDDFEVLHQALDESFSHETCFEYSKKFSVQNETKQMLQASQRILNK